MSAGTKRAKAKKRGRNSGIKQISQEAHGLWIDREFLRKHMNPVPKFVRPDSSHAERDLNRYLELADTLLNTNTEEHRRNTD
jgi:hypothetical protein